MLKKSILSGLIAITSLMSQISYADNTIKSGTYEFVKLVVTPEKKIQGVFLEEFGVGVNISCSFNFEGQLTDKKVTPLRTWGSQEIMGSIESVQDGVKLTVNDDHPGCAGLSGHFLKEGMEIKLDEEKKWIRFATINKDKVYLSKVNNKDIKSKFYIIKDDVFAILKEDGDKVFIEYINNNAKSFKGWINKSDYKDFKDDLKMD